jgi:hypothetical protein
MELTLQWCCCSTLFTTMGVGKNLLVLSGALSLAAYHLPAFVTAKQTWIPRDYPYIIAIERAGMVFALPMINAILVID